MIMAYEKVFGKLMCEHVAEILTFLSESQRQGKRLDEVERGLLQRLMELGRATLEEYVQQAGDGNAGPTVQQEGRCLHRSAEPHAKTYRSIFGPLEIRRYVYWIRPGQKIEAAPLDARLGLPAGEPSYVLEDLVGRLATEMPYAQVVAWLEENLGIRTTVRAAETMVAKLDPYAESFQAARAPIQVSSEAEVLVVTGDGKGVPMRRPLEQRLEEELGIRRHKRHHKTTYAKARTRRSRGTPGSRKQMAYVGAVYSIAAWKRCPQDLLDEVHHAAAQRDRPRPQNKRLWAEMTQIRQGRVCEGARRLFVRLAREVRSRDGPRPKPIVCVMDGQTSLWELQQTYLPKATGILDIFHVMEKLWKAAYAFHPQGSAEAEAFVDRFLAMLLEGKVGYAIGTLRRLLKQNKLSASRRKGLHEAIRYFDANRERMRYDEYLKAGYPIGSGVAEGACRHVVKDRMERTGMRWEIEGAQPVLHLRAVQLSDGWSQFIEHRIQREQTALYGVAA